MKHKRFVHSFIWAMIILVALNLLIWKLWTEDLLSNRTYQGGDLARLGYLPASKHLRTNVDDLPRRHVEQENHDGSSVDLLTIGDSFSNGGAGGRNSYYQDYIASLQELKVLNVEPFRDLDIFSVLISYYHNGYLDRIKPKYILVSSAELSSLEKFSKQFDFAERMPVEEIHRHGRMGFKERMEVPPFINTGNYKFLVNQFWIRSHDVTRYNPIMLKKLDRPFFSVRAADTLLFLQSEFRRILPTDPQALAALNDNFNRLADLMATKGIRLYFMPCANKYTLYREFLVNKPAQSSDFFESLSCLPKRYELIDTKALLLPAVRAGEKDIYYADDTHWSWRASELIFSRTHFTPLAGSH